MTDQPQGDIRDAVRARYAAAAVRSAAGEHERARAVEAESCCGPGGCGAEPVEVAFGGQLYDPAESAEAPAAAVAASLGCGVPTVVADLQPGERSLTSGRGQARTC